MQDFMLLLDYSETTFRIDNPDMKRGERVRVLKGEFAGIEGELIRIRGHKRVVVRLEGLFSMVAGNYIPKEYLEMI
jgi:transcription antitermination factor NusG